jgi:signal transduction histidine kinase
MIIIAAAWISLLLLAGGIALDRVLTNAVSDNFDDQMEYVLTAMIASSEIGPDGEIRLNRPLGDQRFLEPNSGLYYQISGQGKEPWPSRSLWDRTLKVDYSHDDTEPHFRNSDEFQGEPLRILERVIVLPDSDTRWIFMVAASRESLDAQITELRTVLATAFAVLAFGLIILAALQTFYGLWPLRDVRREIAAMRSGRQHRLHDALPDEVMPMVNELNALLDHNEKQAEEARRHAGNLAVQEIQLHLDELFAHIVAPD